MPIERWDRIQAVYLEALEVDGEHRAVFLGEACADDEELRHEVESLLKAHQDAGTFLQTPALVVAAETRNRLENATLLSPLDQHINQYQILARLGAGGMGEVWLAEDTKLHRKVALKLLPTAFTNDRERVRRFAQEARAASALNHPNIITIHDLSEADSGCFIVMEHVAGQTLRALSAAPIAHDNLLHWSGQIAKALHAAHAAKIIHRDIKPDNIMVRDDGYVKVLDFGLARLNTTREDLSSALTMAGTVMGTVKYMSPEQTRGEVVTTASDVFAFGIVLYELATGQHPFNGVTLFTVMQAITNQMPAPPSQLNTALPPAFDALVLQMLAKDAAARPSAQAVEKALLAIERRRDGETEGKSDRETLIFSPSLPRSISPSLRHTVGRTAERHELRATFTAAQAAHGSLVCVAGEPGIGKTTLVEDFLTDLAAEQPCTIARGRCSERLAGTEAYLPWLEALENLLSGEQSIAVTMKQLAPTWYAQVVPLAAESEESARLLNEVKAASQERMKRELGNFLTAVAQAQPLVLFFDDLHWADVSTIDLLSFLASKLATLRVLVIVTYRPSDMLLEKHPFLQIKPDLQARGLCRELPLEFLTEAEIAQYLTLEFPAHRFPAEFPQLIHAKTEGSPLFMADLVRYLRDRHVIAQTSGTWALEQALPDIERELPESVRGMIERKIAQLSEEDRKLLTCASVQGYEFDSAVVAQVLSLDADEVEERLEKLERVFAFVKLTSEAEFPNRTLTLKYRFVHVLYQNALDGALRVTRRVSLSKAVVQTLLDFYGEAKTFIASELARLFEVARDWTQAVEFYLLASQQASKVFANAEAIVLAQRGLELLKSLPDTPQRTQQELALELTRGMALSGTRGYAAPETGASYARARELCQEASTAPELLPVFWGGWGFYAVAGALDSARQIGEQFVQMAQKIGDRGMLTAAHQALGSTWVFIGELVASRENLELSISFYDPTTNQANRSRLGLDPGIYCLTQFVRTLWLLGYPDQARQRLQQAFALSRESGDIRGLAYTQFQAVDFHSYVREYEQAQSWLEKCVAHCNEHDIAQERAWVTAFGGSAVAAQGETEKGIAMIRDTIAVLEEMGARVALTQFHTMLAQLLGEAGKTEEALATLTEAMQLSARMNENYFNAEIQRLKGELLLKTGATAQEAEACFHQAIETAQQQSAKSWELRATMSLARLWQQQNKIAEAQQMLTTIYGWFTEGFDTADLQDAKTLLDELQR